MRSENYTTPASETKPRLSIPVRTYGGWRGWNAYQLALLDCALASLRPGQVISTEAVFFPSTEAIAYNFD